MSARARIWLAGVVLAGATLAGCGEPTLTEILVVVDTDMVVPDDLRTVRFQVRGPDGSTQVALGDLTVERPAVLGMVYRSGALGPLEVSVSGERATGDSVRQRLARVSFVEGRALMLRMDLHAACDSSVRCTQEETCAEGRCRTVEVAEAELVDWPGAAPRLDAGTVVDVDAGADAGAPDAGFDAGTVTCAGDGGCDDSIACTMDSCGAGLCAFTPDDSACPDDMVACTMERCDQAQGCLSLPVDAMCDDGQACTVDTCDPVTGCASVPDDARCDDGIACTTDVCDPVMGCVSTPVDVACDDGIPCTTDTCSPTAGCSTRVDHASCAVGDYCDSAFARACVSGPTFGDVYSIFSARCAPCHTRRPFEANLDYSSQPMAYAELVNVTAECGAGANTLVIPRNATDSLLWRKLSGVNLCGEMMPRRTMSLPAADIATVEQWINAGAPNN